MVAKCLRPHPSFSSFISKNSERTGRETRQMSLRHEFRVKKKENVNNLMQT
jgi:hypothetical protein